MADPRQATNSSMIDLKAELFRKQQEYKQLKAQNASDFVKGVKPDKQGKGDKIWSKKNAGVLQRASKDLAEKEEEDNVMERSRRALEAKSKIYDKIASSSGIPDEDGSEGYLVDFQRKAVDRIVEQRRGEAKTAVTTAPGQELDTCAGQGESDDDLHSDKPIPLPANPGEEWVDYVDTFGRSRRCLKKDLPVLEKQERPLGRPPGDGGLQLKEGTTLLSADMKRELRRQQWEKEMEEAANGPVHYANVQFDEIRTHGTGFYQFSKDSNLREEQMEMLNKLREQTMEGRQRSDRIKEKRKAALEARLAKVKQRRKMKGDGLIEVDSKEEEQQKDSEDATPPATEQETEPLTRDDNWRRSAPVREWDIGKEKLPEWNAKRYVEQKRSERESEFAPPQFYFNQKNTPPPAGRPGKQGVSSGRNRSQNGAGHGEMTPPSSAASSNTEALLKQIRQSVGAVAHAHGRVDKDLGPAGSNEEGSDSLLIHEAQVDVTSIPLPRAGPVSVESVKERRQDTGVAGEDCRTGGAGVEQIRQQAQAASCCQTPLPVQADQQQQLAFCGPVPDVSLPPPGYQPQILSQQADGAPLPQPFMPSFTAASLVPSAQGQSSGTPFMFPSQQASEQSSGALFMYPSQQGLLSSQPHPIAQDAPAVRPTHPKPAVSRSSVPKVSMVDKRFMQNREVSEEDLLGYMAHTSADPLAKIQAVAYTPGHFSSMSSSQVQESAPATPCTETAGAADGETARPATQAPKPGAQTEGVIFGVPDFLQPAAMPATSYQPGSFMAAKEAAAQRAEEEYEAARKKTQYSSAPVLYGRPAAGPEQEGTDGCGNENQGGQSAGQAQGDEANEEFAKFMREVRGGR